MGWVCICGGRASGTPWAHTGKRVDAVTLFQEIYKDYRRFRASGEKCVPTLLKQGLWAACVYRVSHWVMARVKIWPLRNLAGFGCTLARKFIEITTAISMPVECSIGEGLYIGHFGPTMFPYMGRVGKNCDLSMGVTLGIGGRGALRGAPIVGDRVHIGVNAVIIGKVEIGHDAVISAGAIVTRSIPPRGVAMGNPARVVSYEGSFEMIRYDGMEVDPERLASLAEQQVEMARGADPVRKEPAANDNREGVPAPVGAAK